MPLSHNQVKTNIKYPLSSYTVLYCITLIVGILGYFIHSGSFDYENKTTHKTIHPSTPILLQQTVEQNLTPVLDSYHEIKKPPIIFQNIIAAPIIGLKLVIDFIIFVLGMGIFLQMLKEMGVINTILQYIFRYNCSYFTTASVFLFLIALISSIAGLRDENIFFLSLLLPLNQYYNFSKKSLALLILLGCVVGIGSSVLNPTIVGIFASLSGLPISSGIIARVLLFICLYVMSLLFIYKVFPKYLVNTIIPEQFMPININTREILGTICLSLALLILVTTLILKVPLIISESYFLFLTILSGIIAGKKEYQIINIIKKGTKELLPITLNVGIARGILYILETNGLKDTILFFGSQVLNNHLPLLLFSMLVIIIITLLYFIINSTSAVSGLSLPLIFPLTAPYHITYQVFIVWFLIATTISQVFNPTGYLLSQLRTETAITYKEWCKLISPYIICTLLFLWLMSIYIL